MHHVVLERWSRGESWLHRRDPRAKILALLFFLVLVATARGSLLPAALDCVLLLAAFVSAGLPASGALTRSLVVLPFGAAFAVVSWLAGDPARAQALLVKSYVSAFAVLLVVATTPLPRLLKGLELLGVPRFLLLVTQFLYRYLFVISEEAQHMRVAAQARGGGRRAAHRRAGFRAAAGILAVLFSRSYAHAAEVHQAMQARGFEGRFRLLALPRFGWADTAFLGAAVLLPVAMRLAAGRLA